MFLSPAELQQILDCAPKGFKSSDDGLFEAVNKALVPEYKKLGVITSPEETDTTTSNTKNPTENVLDCNVPGCFQMFENVAAYQTHYNSVHRYICATCKRTLPTPHLLDIHISESHDSYFQAKVERGEPMFACFLEECKELLQTPAARREHCIKLHKFPSNFRFDQVSGTKKNKHDKSKMDVDKQASSSTSSSSKVKSFTFGHGTERSFNKTCRKKGEALADMSDLMDALEEQT